jgi:hypothetical protein
MCFEYIATEDCYCGVEVDRTITQWWCEEAGNEWASCGKYIWEPLSIEKECEDCKRKRIKKQKKKEQGGEDEDQDDK